MQVRAGKTTSEWAPWPPSDRGPVDPARRAHGRARPLRAHPGSAARRTYGVLCSFSIRLVTFFSFLSVFKTRSWPLMPPLSADFCKASPNL